MKNTVNIYLRPLKEEDALTSYKWRNDPEVWRLTGSRPDIVITPEIETSWIKKVLKDPTCRRFAICIAGSDEYIGNVQLTNITKQDAEFHIFIGEKKYWGRGIGYKATIELSRITRKHLSLKQIYLYVKPENTAAVKIYEKAGFRFVGEEKMILEL
ncbi:MAG: N-acetyltransferase [Bacteroidetes bacterium]|nr:MAG: N-acetyltransferase [Bacteroidota bacterium]